MSQLGEFVDEMTIRRALLDLEARDNQQDLDLEFSTAEIAEAMVNCARRYHDVEPIGCERVDPSMMPRDTRVFIDGTIAELLLSSMARLGRNEIDVVAGGVTANLTSGRRRATAELYRMIVERFERAATARKLSQRVNAMFQVVG